MWTKDKYENKTLKIKKENEGPSYVLNLLRNLKEQSNKRDKP